MKMIRKKKKFIVKMFACIGMKIRNRKNSFIKHNVTRNIDPASSNIQTLVPFTHVTITKKSILLWNETQVYVFRRVED